MRRVGIEKPIVGRNIRVGKHVEQRRFSGVCISDHRHAPDLPFIPEPALSIPDTADVG